MKIVTIDFDIIMRPSIESYNYFINEEGCGIDQLEQEFVHFQNCQADLSIYKLLTDFILNVESEKIFFISSHKDILQFVNDSVDFANLTSAFVGGTGDFVNLFEPNATKLEKMGYGYVYDSVGKYSGEVPYTAFNAKRSYVSANKDIIDGFRKAIDKGLV